jgi:anti-sigma factor RsiW
LGLYSNEHLTTAQLSASLDAELTGSELTLCTAHLQTCPQCQAILADLRVTSLLLRKLPQVDVPRSFVLPPTLTVLPAASGRQRGRLQRPLSLRRPWRVVSTLAAVIGLLFILLASPALLPQTKYAASTSGAPVLNSAAGSQANTPPVYGTRSATAPDGHLTEQARATARAREQQTPVSGGSGVISGQQTDRPAVFDLAQPSARLGIGVGLLALGILGIVFTRRPRREQH